MGLYDHFPYTNFHELNLMWILEAIKHLETTVENFVALNTIKYADPIQWNITTQYEANTVVVDPQTGTAYISVQPVPSGVAITNTDYWTVVFSLSGILAVNENITLRDDGSEPLATFASNAGDWLIWNSTLYKVSQTINVNEAYVAGYNLTRYTVELFIKDYIQDLKDDIQDLNDIIGSLTDLTTSDKTSIVNAINELVTNITTIVNDIGDLSILTTQDKSSIVNAINELNTNISVKAFATPEDFGAVGDGVTDDTLAVQAAIDKGINDKMPVLLRATYLTNTLWVHGKVEILGGGTIITPPFRYDTLTSALNDTDRYFTTDHPEYYHPHTFITVGNWQSLVVTSVNGNEIHVQPAYVENDTDVVNNAANGTTVAIHKMAIWIASTQIYAASVIPILSDVNIHDINIKGNQSGYIAGNSTPMDYRQNGHITSYACKNLQIHHCNFDTCQCNVLNIQGYELNCRISDNAISNSIPADNRTDVPAYGICFHYDSRFYLDSSQVAHKAIITNNAIDNCLGGIFTSATTNSIIANNTIKDCSVRGIMLYSGDYNMQERDNVVTGNVLNNCGTTGTDEFAPIVILNTNRDVIADNVIFGGYNGIYLRDSLGIKIDSNLFMGQTNYSIYYYSGSRIDITNNRFDNNAKTHIMLYDHETGGYINIINNSHNGNPTDNCIHAYLCKNVIISNENISQGLSGVRLLTVNTGLITLGDVLVKDCFVSAGVAGTTAELNLLKYMDCINNSYTRISNIT